MVLINRRKLNWKNRSYNIANKYKIIQDVKHTIEQYHIVYNEWDTKRWRKNESHVSFQIPGCRTVRLPL